MSLWNGVLIHNGKEACAIGFEIRIPRKKNKESLRKIPSKIYGSNFIMEEKQKHFLSKFESEDLRTNW